MSTTKRTVEELLSKLPDDSSLEDIQYHLYVLQKVHNGLEDVRQRGTIPQEAVEAKLRRWLSA